MLDDELVGLGALVERLHLGELVEDRGVDVIPIRGRNRVQHLVDAQVCQRELFSAAKEEGPGAEALREEAEETRELLLDELGAQLDLELFGWREEG